MDVYHGAWIAAVSADFENSGQFMFWVERQGNKTSQANSAIHPNHLSKTSQLKDFLSTDLSLTKALLDNLNPVVATFYAALPSVDQQPLPSLEMASLSGDYLPDEYDWQIWTINWYCYQQTIDVSA